MSEWTPDDVSDWLVSIGMSDYKAIAVGGGHDLQGQGHRINGSRLLNLDANDLNNFGVRSLQHKSYILEKVKQYLHYQQQHPPSGGQGQGSSSAVAGGVTMTRI